MVKEDVRISKTKRDLRNALYELMLTTPFEKITVGDICSHAMVNRITFYKHYKDKFELLSDIFLNIKNDIIKRASKENMSLAVQEDALNFILNLMECVVEYSIQQKTFLMSINNNDLVATIISNIIEKSVNDLFAALAKEVTFRYPIDFLSAAVTGAITYLIRYWIFHGADKTKDKFLAATKTFISEFFVSKLIMEYPQD